MFEFNLIGNQSKNTEFSSQDIIWVGNCQRNNNLKICDFYHSMNFCFSNHFKTHVQVFYCFPSNHCGHQNTQHPPKVATGLPPQLSKHQTYLLQNSTFQPTSSFLVIPSSLETFYLVRLLPLTSSPFLACISSLESSTFLSSSYLLASSSFLERFFSLSTSLCQTIPSFYESPSDHPKSSHLPSTSFLTNPPCSSSVNPLA